MKRLNFVHSLMTITNLEYYLLIIAALFTNQEIFRYPTSNFLINMEKKQNTRSK